MKKVSTNTLYCGLLGLAFVLHFGLLEQNPQNPIGIKYLTELYLAACLGFSAMFLVGTVGAERKDYSVAFLFCLFSAFTFTFLPALFAELFYGQPLVYGVIEERRVLLCFSVIPLLYLAKRVSAAQFENCILIVALGAVVLSWLCYFEVLPDLRDGMDLDLSRPGRASTGAFALIIGYCLSIYFWGKGKSPIDGSPRSSLRYGLLALVYLATLVFVTQTRQVILLCIIFTFLCLRVKSVKLAVIGCLLVSPFVIDPDLLELFGVNIDFYMQSAQNGATDNVREATIAQIMDHLHEYNWVPSGSLSLMWNDGFKHYFSYYFFLSDVGVIGTLFRFGFLTIAIIPVSFLVYFKVAKRLNPSLDFTLAVFLAHLSIWPLQGIFEYQEGMTALLFVFQALKTFHSQMPNESLSNHPEREPYQLA